MSDLVNAFGDKVILKTETVDPWPEQVRDLTMDEISLRNKSAEKVAELSLRYPIANVTPGQFNPAVLDLLWAYWLEDSREDKPETVMLVTTLADAFGWYLNDSLGMKWVELTDQTGQSIALRHLNGITVYPKSSIEKRLETHGTGFFSDIFAYVESKILCKE